MNAYHICLACRRTLNRNRLHKRFQWHPRATFISLSDSPITTDEKSRDELLNLGNVEGGGRQRYAGLRPSQERRKQIPRQPSLREDGDQLEALFEETLKRPYPGPNEIPQPIASVQPYIHADTLRKMLVDESGPVGDSWRFFVEHFGPEAWRRGSTDQKTLPRNLHLSKNLLARRLVAAKRMDPFSLNLPTVSEFTKVYSQLGVLRCQEWEQLMLIVIEGLITLDKGSSQHIAHQERAILDLISAWNIVYRRLGTALEFPPDGSPWDWTHIPSTPAAHALHIYRRFGTQRHFAQFAPGFPVRLQSTMAVIAVATFALLTRESMANNSMLQNASPLLSSFAAAISISGFEVASLVGLINVPPSVNEFLMQTASKTKEIASNMMKVSLIEHEARSKASSNSGLFPKGKPMAGISLSSSIRTDISSIKKRLYDAMLREDAPQVDKLWSDVLNLTVDKESPSMDLGGTLGSENKMPRRTLTTDLCNYFIYIYMALHHSSRAIDVWNHMVRRGLLPTIRTWESMLSGCRARRDHKAMEDVWMKMLHLGVQPDVVCWTIRISGLMECHMVDKAMHALDEMGRLWVAANKKEVQDPHKKGSRRTASVTQSELKAVKPTIELINAAVAGLLLRNRQPELAHKVLAWGATFNVKPDVITYNTLLTGLIRDGNSNEVMALLKHMQKEGIEADVATFTTILNEIFRNSGELTRAEQKAITENVFSEMDAAGIDANLPVYGKMIHQLLQGSSRNLTAVDSVMEHMVAHGVKPTTYIYTILVSHYFSQEPPDIDAVRRLIEHARMEIGSVDHKFWDRVVEGYARAGDTAAAMRVLGKLESRGNHASWVTKQVLLTSLVQNDEWALARSLVSNIKDDSEGEKRRYEKGKDQKQFWRLAAELELL